MILGLGTDIVEIERVEKMLERHKETFPQRILSTDELVIFHKRKDKAQFLAGRWAVKEAASKALGTGIGASCAFNEISAIPNDLGKPSLTFSGKALETFNSLNASSVHLSISHEKKYAVATVIIEN